MRTRSVCLLVMLLLLSATGAVAQSGTISGFVRDAVTQAPVSGALVEASAAGRTASSVLTDRNGGFRITNLPAGSYTLTASTLGYETTRSEAVQLSAGGVSEVTIRMQPAAVSLNPLVVTASRGEERVLDAPARVEVVTEAQIDVRPTVTPIDHLRGVPGVDVASTGLQSTNVVARGFNNVFSGSLHALTDHRIAGIPSLRVNLMHMVPLTDADIGSMEVVLGPGAALYGPNTANGVLHILTKSPLSSQGTTLSVGGGERSFLQIGGRTSQLLTPNFGIKVSGQYMRGDDWRYTDPAEVIEQQKFASNLEFFRADLMRASGISQAEADARIARIGARDFDIERMSGEVRADWRVTPEMTTVFSVGTNNSASGIELTGLGAGQVEDWQYTYYQARTTWNRFFGQVYLNTSDAGDTYLLRNGAPIVDRSKLFVAQAQHGFELGARQNFTYGIDYLYTMPETEGTINGLYEDEDETRELGAYLQSETQLTDQFELVLAGRVDTHSALPDPIFSPRAAIVFKPEENHAFRVSYNRAFSTPSSLTQFLDLGTSIPNSSLARLGYSVRVQGTGDTGFSFAQPGGGYLMRSPFTPAQLGGPAQLLPADAVSFWAAAVQVIAAQAAAAGQPLPTNLVQYLLQLQPGSADIGTNYFDVVRNEVGPLASLGLGDLDPIRESTSNTYEVGYKGILGGRVMLAADGWYSQRENLVTPLTIQTPLLLMNGQQIGGFLVPRFMQDLGMSQAEATALATQLATGMAQVPVGVISSADVHANGPQLLTTYVNVDESIDVWGMDLSASALLTDFWTLGLTGSFVNDDVFETSSGMQVMLNAPRKKGSASLSYLNQNAPFNGEMRLRYTDGFPVNSGVYIGTRCLGDTSPLAEDCVDSYTLLDTTLGYKLPFRPDATIQVAVQNLLDQKYRSFPGSPELGRMALIRLRYEF